MLRRALVALGLLLGASTAQAAGYNPSYTITPAALGVSGAALSSNPSFTVRTDGYANLTVYIQLTRSAVSSVALNCTAGPNAAVQAPLAVAQVGGNGSISMAPASWAYPVTTSGTLRIIVGPVNDVMTTCTLGGTGATSSDLVSVYARVAGAP